MKTPFTLAAAVVLAAASASVAAPGRTELPTEWHLSAPPGAKTPTGTLPQGAALTADGRHLVVVEDGDAPAAVRVLDAGTLAVERTIAMKGATADPLPDPSGSGVWVSGAGQDTLVHLDAATGTIDRTIALPKGSWASAIARSPDGKQLAVSCELTSSIALVDLATGAVGTPITVGHHPYGLTYSPDGRRVYVANWAESSVSVIDVASSSVHTTIAVGKHPDHVLLAADGKRLFVSEADDDTIGVIDLATDMRVSGANAAPFNGRLFGASPSALALAPDGKRLFVADSAINAIAVLDVSGETPHFIGAMPTGWYPTAVVLDPGGTALDVVDGKGESSHANPQFSPYSGNYDGYVASLAVGSVRRIPIPDDAALAADLDEVRDDGGPELHRALREPERPDRIPEDSVLRFGGPIRHVVYIVKENRTYDQVLGDIPQADGDPSLALFDATVTPNQHAIARRFGVFDDTFADAEVSADGHNWSMAAFANDYLERNWPPNYGGRRSLYDFEDEAEGSIPHGGYLWNAAINAGRTVRNYGEFTTEITLTPKPHIVSHMAELSKVTDPLYPGFDLSYSDLDREAEWAREFAGYEHDDNLPQLEIVRLPNDHTAGTRRNKPTPKAYVAQNDAAVGRLVSTVSHSKYWKDTAIFIVEDDAQNGPDHVGDQRMPVYVVSPYATGGIRHEHYSTAGIVRTIELILGLEPMSVYDAAARPLYAAFGTHADLRPFDALPANADLGVTNTASAYGSRESASLDFTREDRVPAATLNRIIWHAVRGAQATPPPYGAF
jgi:YVTN family beta-propeller protein